MCVVKRSSEDEVTRRKEMAADSVADRYPKIANVMPLSEKHFSVGKLSE
jgi:hypothetical protein